MGALYHVNSNDLKEKVISESVRVCKSGGIVVFTYLSASANKSESVGHNRPAPVQVGIFFASAPHEIEGMAVKFGLKKIHHISTRSCSHFEDHINELSDDDFNKYMEHRYLTCEDDGAAGDVALWIGKKL